MDWQAYYTGGVVIILIAALVSRRMGPDVAFLCALAGLLVGGVLKPAEAVFGFANPAVITVGLLYVVALGLKETGGMTTISRRLLGRPSSLRKAQLRLLSPVAVLSAFVNNTPVVAMFLPVLSGWARRHNLNASQLFMPLSFAAMLGGACTLIGTSTNLVVNELLIEHAVSGHSTTADGSQVQSFSMFTLSIVGLPVMLVGGLYMLLAAPKLLARREGRTLTAEDPRNYTVWMRIKPDSRIVGQSIDQAGLRQLRGLFSQRDRARR
jgi:di/tricarboxylate transporter